MNFLQPFLKNGGVCYRLQILPDLHKFSIKRKFLLFPFWQYQIMDLVKKNPISWMSNLALFYRDVGGFGNRSRKYEYCSLNSFKFLWEMSKGCILMNKRQFWTSYIVCLRYSFSNLKKFEFPRFSVNCWFHCPVTFVMFLWSIQIWYHCVDLVNTYPTTPTLCLYNAKRVRDRQTQLFWKKGGGVKNGPAKHWNQWSNVFIFLWVPNWCIFTIKKIILSLFDKLYEI
jgi:hypothetical protein